jgi:hypothetical protein
MEAFKVGQHLARLYSVRVHRRKIRLIEGNSKCCHLKKLIYKETLRQVFICLRPGAPYPPPITHCIRVYSILINTGKGERGGELREGERGNSSQSWVKNTNMTDCISSL